ncbi:MAG: trehalose-6-phosphate synthase [Elusimicrobiota bacterium]|nr:MAG: trehalose-6-phosphate synthase [Elusimicrobiota bacterium]
MRVTFRLVVSIVLAAAAVSAGWTFFSARAERARLIDELDHRGSLLAEGLREAAEPLAKRADAKALERIAGRFGGRERLRGVSLHRPDGTAVAATSGLPPTAPPPREGRPFDCGLLDDGSLHRCTAPLEESPGFIAVFHGAAHVEAGVREVWRRGFMRLLTQVLLMSAITLWIVHLDVLAPIERTVEWMRLLRAGEDPGPAPPQGSVLGPLAREATKLARSLETARAAAEEEARLRHAGHALWTPERLKEHTKDRLRGKPMIVVANREPYLHVRKDGAVTVLRPASGLVAGVEPILKACGGTWVAHGAGDADRETVDSSDRVRVPPEEPRYSLRRVWLTREQEEGYYYGFANEGLWPLCHIAHARPQFREQDWKQYHAVNRLFADAVLTEIEGVEEPCVLIQDYHFALLPRMIKEARPDARVSLFWHIPWPNPEAFGICPWQREILDGMLGADVVGFHIQYHCNNFLETVDRALECRIDWERFAVRRGGHATLVKPYPISVALEENAGPPPSKEELLRSIGARGTLLVLGVDRLDYTKGILERFLAVERFLEDNPAYVGRFVFVELGAPSRTTIPRYRDFVEEVKREALRINARFDTKDTRGWRPIVLAVGHHERTEVARWYRVADACVVTSLHDGMNLVAKEYVASDREEPGTLILSRFTGASRELRDALIVNPYDVERVAAALRQAIEMEPEERRRRWESMREAVREHNIYRWGARLVDDLSRARPAGAAST